MRTALILSGVLHVALFLIAVVGLPRVQDRLVMMPEAIPVEVVDIGLLTNTRVEKAEPKPQPKPQPAPPRTQPPPPPPQAQAEPTPPPPVKTPEPPKQVAQAEPEPKPEPKKEEPKPPPKKEEPKPEPPKKAETKPEPPKKEEPKKEPPKKEEPKRDFASILKDLEKMKEETAPSPQPQEKTETAEAPSSIDPSKSDRLTISEEDAVRRAISACWFVDGGARNAESQRVSIRVVMRPDRTVQEARIVESSADRATTERALRAVLNPRCQPLPLPEGQYDRWRTIVFNFDPRDML